MDFIVSTNRMTNNCESFHDPLIAFIIPIYTMLLMFGKFLRPIHTLNYEANKIYGNING